jgi:NAD(P)H dehydrogenase (quinone)
MHTLIITAHPSSHGFTHKIAQSFIKSLSHNPQNTHEIIDLYDPEWKQGFLTFENIKDLPQYPIKDKIQAKISTADELVFIHPIWWGSMPAILKNFIDQNFSAGFAYKYTKDGLKKLLLGKTARIFLTCDVPLWKYLLIGLPIMTSWYFPILDYCGLQVKSFTVFDKMRKRHETQLIKWLDQTSDPTKTDKFSIILGIFKIMSRINSWIGV